MIAVAIWQIVFQTLHCPEGGLSMIVCLLEESHRTQVWFETLEIFSSIANASPKSFSSSIDEVYLRVFETHTYLLPPLHVI
jgi:hypothetical protein